MPEDDLNEQLQQDLLESITYAVEESDPTQWEDTDEDVKAIGEDEAKAKAELDDDDEEKVDYTQWIKRGKIYIPTDNSKRVKKVEPGFYNLRISDKIGPYLFKKDLKLDNLIDLPNKETKEVLEGIRTFWERKDKFKEYGFAFKRGILLYGPPGSGKTSLINLLCFDLINNMNGVIVTLTTRNELNLYSQIMPEIFRIIEPNRPIITIIEDIDGLCESTGAETELINMLDGIDQMENVVYIATTNYAEKLSRRILNRPNRFDRRILIGYPDENVRREYIKFKLKPSDIESIDLDKWVKETKGMTLAHIGELIKSVIILGNDIDDTVKLLKSFSVTPQSHDYNKEDYTAEQGRATIGFALSSLMNQETIHVKKGK
jgi:DNA replication protein DnaC